MYLPTIDQVETAVAIGGGIVTLAGAFCALTPTPPPNTAWGRIYRYIEIAALLVGKAKQIGIVPPDPAIDKIADEIKGAKSDA